MQAHKLSDKQLCALLKGNRLRGEWRETLLQELHRRQLIPDYLKSIAEENTEDSPPAAELDFRGMLGVAAFPFFAPINTLMAVRHLSEKHNRAFKQHLLMVLIGSAFWAVAAVIAGALFLLTR